MLLMPIWVSSLWLYLLLPVSSPANTHGLWVMASLLLVTPPTLCHSWSSLVPHLPTHTMRWLNQAHRCGGLTRLTVA